MQELILAKRDERGWSYRHLESRSHGMVRNQRWQQLATGERVKEFPAPATIVAIADTLEIDVTTVVLAAAASIGLGVSRHGSHLAQMLPSSADELSPEMRDAVLSVIRAALAADPKRNAWQMGGVTEVVSREPRAQSVSEHVTKRRGRAKS
ncbi:MAG: hypothetical protein ACRDQ1_16275 [Sciscionella sp.]